jgi:hypothetical protein
MFFESQAKIVNDNISAIIFNGLESSDHIHTTLYRCQIIRSKNRDLEKTDYQKLLENEISRLKDKLELNKCYIHIKDEFECLDIPLADKKDIFFYLYWLRSLDKKRTAYIKHKLNVLSPKLRLLHDCEVCGQVFNLEFGINCYSSGSKCPHCKHMPEELCTCSACLKNDVILKNNIHNFYGLACDQIEINFELIVKYIYQKIELKYEVDPNLLYLKPIKHKYSSLNSDERCFLSEYENILSTGGASIELEDLIPYLPLKEPLKLKERLLNHGVIFYKTDMNLISINTVKSTLMDMILDSIGVTYVSDYSKTSINSMSTINIDMQGLWTDANLQKITKLINVDVPKIKLSDYLHNKIEITIHNIVKKYKTLEINPHYLNKPKAKLNKTSNSGQHIKSIFRSPQEAHSYQLLVKQHPHHTILPNVKACDLLTLESLIQEFTTEEMKYLNNCIFDFVVIDHQGLPIKVIEAQHGRHHNLPIYIKKDHLKQRLCKMALIEFEEIHGHFDSAFFALQEL